MSVIICITNLISTNFSRCKIKTDKDFSLRLSFSSSYLPTFSDGAFPNVGLCSFLRDFHPGDLVDKLREARLYIMSLNRKSDAIARCLAIISFRLNPSMAARIIVAFLFWRRFSSYRDRHTTFTKKAPREPWAVLRLVILLSSRRSIDLGAWTIVRWCAFLDSLALWNPSGSVSDSRRPDWIISHGQWR